MGCCEHGFLNSSEEERLLRGKEEYLGFSSFMCTDMDLYVRKICAKPHLNKNQFQVLMEKLNTADKSPEKDTAALCFFRSTLYYQGEYDRTLLLILVVLYCRGSYLDRARVLFDIKDDQLRCEITSVEAHTLAHFMVEIALSGAFSLIFEESMGKEPALLLNKYKSSLSKVFGRVEAALSNMLTGKKSICRLEDLLETAKNPSLGRLLTAVGLRELACELLLTSTPSRKSSGKTSLA